MQPRSLNGCATGRKPRAHELSRPAAGDLAHYPVLDRAVRGNVLARQRSLSYVFFIFAAVLVWLGLWAAGTGLGPGSILPGIGGGAAVGLVGIILYRRGR